MIRSFADLEALAARLKMPVKWVGAMVFIGLTLCLWAGIGACLVPLVLQDGLSRPETTGLCITAGIVVFVPWFVLKRANKKK